MPQNALHVGRQRRPPEFFLQADAASAFDQLFLQGPVLEVACAAHMRRYFTRRGTLRRWQPRPLIELMRDPSRLEPSIVEELTALLPDRWHDAHPRFHLEINRKTRLVGDAA